MHAPSNKSEAESKTQRPTFWSRFSQFYTLGALESVGETRVSGLLERFDEMERVSGFATGDLIRVRWNSRLYTFRIGCVLETTVPSLSFFSSKFYRNIDPVSRRSKMQRRATALNPVISVKFAELAKKKREAELAEESKTFQRGVTNCSQSLELCKTVFVRFALSVREKERETSSVSKASLKVRTQRRDVALWPL